MNEWEKKTKQKNTCRESSAAFKGMFCTKYRVFKLHIKKTLRFALQYNEICYFICKNLINKKLFKWNAVTGLYIKYNEYN